MYFCSWILFHTQTNTNMHLCTNVSLTSAVYIRPKQTRRAKKNNLAFNLAGKTKTSPTQTPPTPTATHRQTKKRRMCLIGCRHLNPMRRPVYVCVLCVCLYFTGVQSPVFSPNENPGSGSSETQHTLFGF